MGFNLANYEPVEDRLARFWTDHPKGRVLTDLVPAPDGQWIVKATVYRDTGVERADATGYAHELVTERGVNSTSALENCETSAIGRALANLGYAPKGARPSREEMAKADRPAPDPLAAIKAEVWVEAQKHGIKDAQTLAAHFAEVMGGLVLSTAGEADLRGYLTALKAREAA